MIRTWPDKILKKQTTVVSDFGTLDSLVTELQDTLAMSGGIGLAANQIGDLRRVCVIRVPSGADEPSSEWHDRLIILINPVVLINQGRCSRQEGCLSFPGIREFVERAANVTVQAQGVDGQCFTIQGTNLLAACLQHEIDHLDGVVFLDRMSRLKARLALKTLHW
jgi:peptide deformylase